LDNFKLKICADRECNVKFRQFNSLNKYCSPVCKNKNTVVKPKKPYVIPKVSQKRKSLTAIYEKVRIEVLSEAKFKCFVKDCDNVANTIEHQRGHSGFFDDWARDNNIPLHIDKRFLKPCCWFHNQEFENNPQLSKEYQLSKIHKGNK
jgi:hypothetical protein